MRINYLAMDRIDLLYAAKEAARSVAKPTVSAMEAIKRIGRYLLHAPRVVQKFEMQSRVGYLNMMVDSDHAGCVVTRRSTTGTALFHGKHLLRASSNTQTVISMSTGESEFDVIVKGTSIGLGAASMAKDYQVDLRLVVSTDATAGKGIAPRLGAGKVRHLHTQYLWAQGVFDRREADLRKIDTETNVADLMTKHLDGPRVQALLQRAGFQYQTGRARSALAAAV